MWWLEPYSRLFPPKSPFYPRLSASGSGFEGLNFEMNHTNPPQKHIFKEVSLKNSVYKSFVLICSTGSLFCLLSNLALSTVCKQHYYHTYLTYDSIYPPMICILINDTLLFCEPCKFLCDVRYIYNVHQ